MLKAEESPVGYYKLLHQKRETELFLSAVRVKLFSYMENWKTSRTAAEKTGLNPRSLSFYLNALACIGLLEKKGDAYRNTVQSNTYLNESSPLYLGKSLLFREKMMSLHRLDQRLYEGPDCRIAERNQGIEVYDFCEAARTGIPEMYAGRVQALVQASLKLFSSRSPGKILDLGGGSGVLAIELVSAFPDSKGVVFEAPGVAEVSKDLISKRNLGQRMEVMEGDFNTDALDGGYDLIIASGIIDFARDHLDALMAKLRGALNPGGYLYLVAHNVSEDYQSPPEAILGWLSSHLDGLDILLTGKTIEEALARHGFAFIGSNDAGGAFKGLPGSFYKVKEAEL